MCVSKNNPLVLVQRGLLLFIWALSGTALAETAQTKVKVDKVLPWNASELISLYCTVDVPFKNQISSHAEAELSWVLPAGTLVKKDEVIAQQDDFYLQRDSKILDIQIKDAASELSYVKKEYTRLKQLSKKVHTSESQLNLVKRQYEVAQYLQQRLTQQHEVMNYRLNRLKHVATAAGRIANLTAQPGENLSIGQPIVQLLVSQNKELACSLPLELYQKFQIYNHASLKPVQFKFNEQHILVLKRQQARANESDQNLMLFFALPETLQNELVIGQRVQIQMSQKTKDITRVPFDALLIQSGGHYVWTLDESNKVSRQEVTIVATVGSSFIVTSKMKAGTLVVVRGKHLMEQDKEVTPVGNVL